MENNYWQRAFILHHRPFTESSLLVDAFCENSGRITLLAKGARRTKSPLKGLLQLFTPIILHWTGKGAVKTLIKAENITITLPLQTKALYSGFYLNEILARLLEKETPYPELFQDYVECLTRLASLPEQLEASLRTFEFKLLRHLGYGIDFCHCIATGKLVEENIRYRYVHEQGFMTMAQNNPNLFYGRELLAFDNLDFSQAETLIAAKRFTRMVLKNYLGTAPLKSRELFSQALNHGNLKIK